MPRTAASTVPGFRRREPIWLWLVTMGPLLACIALGLAYVQRPALADAAVSDGHPAGVVARDADLEARVVEVLSVAGRARLSGAELVQLLRPWRDGRLDGFDVSVEDGRLSLTLALEHGARWQNLCLSGVRVVVLDGRIRSLVAGHVSLSGRRLGSLEGVELADEANRWLDEAGRVDAAFAARLAAVDSLVVTEDGVVVAVDPTALSEALATAPRQAEAWAAL